MEPNMQGMEQGQEPQAEPQGQAQQASPEDQRAAAAMKSAGMAMMKIVYDPKASKRILDMVQKAEDPVTGIAQAALLVVGEVARQVKGMGPNVAYAAGPVAVAAITELALMAELIKDDQNILRGAMEQVAVMLKQRQGQPAQTEQAPAQQAAPQGIVAGAMQPQETSTKHR